MSAVSDNRSKQTVPTKTISAKPPEQEGMRRSNFFRHWVLPICFTFGITASTFILIRAVDASMSNDPTRILDLFFLTNADEVGDALGGVSEVLIAILGLVITVVAIVVQLAAQRYTPKLVDLFIADRVNIAFFVGMVVASMYSMLLIYSTPSNFLPFWGGLFLLLMSVLILSALVPYFNYVFLFLTPENIINIIRNNANVAMNKVAGQKRSKGELARYQKEVANAMEQISDIALSAVSQMDRNVALMSIRSLKDVMVDHLILKRRMPARWFFAQREYFPALSIDFIKEIFTSRTWVEVKGFMDMELIFKTAIKDMPDAVSAVANNTKIIGLYAIRLKDQQVLSDVVQFFNTFLRQAVNNRNPKAIYNLFYQYRLLAEAVLAEDEKLGEKIFFYFKYYGQIAQNYNIPLILVTACFDLGYLLEKAYLMKAPNLNVLVKMFLEADDNPATQANEFELRSVRKAQLMFASFLHSQGDTQYLQSILDDIAGEPRDRLEAIHGEMKAVTDRKFWEVTDRGVDFFYMDEKKKEHLEEVYKIL